MMSRVDLPPEALALYSSGATVKTVAAPFGCSYDGARMALVRAGVLRQQHQPERKPVAFAVKCPDCGERLDRPHPLGAHIPGCSHGPAIPSSASESAA